MQDVDASPAPHAVSPCALRPAPRLAGGRVLLQPAHGRVGHAPPLAVHHQVPAQQRRHCLPPSSTQALPLMLLPWRALAAARPHPRRPSHPRGAAMLLVTRGCCCCSEPMRAAAALCAPGNATIIALRMASRATSAASAASCGRARTSRDILRGLVLASLREGASEQERCSCHNDFAQQEAAATAAEEPPHTAMLLP